MEGLTSLRATYVTMVRYTARLGMLGTVTAGSLQPYFLSVIKYFRDHQLRSIAVGELLADAIRGLEMQQQCLAPSYTRLPLPAPVSLDIL
jgi:hypothetical protein